MALALLSAFVPGSWRRDAGNAGGGAKPDRAQLETQFKKAETDRTAAKEKTKERADAAAKAMQIASDIAWLAFDAGKFDESATWFATSAKLKEDSYVNGARLLGGIPEDHAPPNSTARSMDKSRARSAARHGRGIERRKSCES